jgi:hypothetical protein
MKCHVPRQECHGPRSNVMVRAGLSWSAQECHGPRRRTTHVFAAGGRFPRQYTPCVTPPPPGALDVPLLFFSPQTVKKGKQTPQYTTAENIRRKCISCNSRRWKINGLAVLAVPAGASCPREPGKFADTVSITACSRISHATATQ